MAVPGSGTLEIKGLHNEKVNDDYTSASTPAANTMVNMYDLVNGGNTSGSIEVTKAGSGTATNYDATNTTGDYEPNTIVPHAMDEWYNYDHDHDPSTATTPTISLSSPDLNSLTLTWDMVGVNQRVYFEIGSLFGSNLGNTALAVNGDAFKTSAGNTDLMQSGAPSTYGGGNFSIPASGYPNKTITIRARAYYNGAYSAYTSNVTGTTRPATPSSLAASSITTGGMTIGWNAPSNGANSYTYYFGTDATATNNTSASTTNTSVAITGLSPNVTYYFAAEAVGDGGTGNLTSTISQISQLGTPTNLHQNSNTTSQIVLDWDEPGGGATSYTVVIGEVNNVGDAGNSTHTSIGTTTYTKTGLEANHTYYFFVKAVGTGTAPDSAFSSGQVVYTKPGVPTSLTTTSIGTGGMTIGWTAPTHGVTSYTYYHGTSSNVSSNSSASTTDVSVAISSLDANTIYYWGVEAVGSGGTTSLVTGNSYTKPNQVSNLAAVTVSSSPTSIDVSWNAPSPGGASNYILKRVITNPYHTMTTFSTQSSTSDTITGLDSNSIYYVGVVAVGPTSLESATKNTDDSNNFVGAYTTPDTPTSLGFSSVSTSGLTFSWTAPSGTITGYTYYFSLYSAGSGLYSTGVANAGTSVAISSLQSNTRYVAAARAINTSGGGAGPISSTINGYTQVAAPTNLGTGTNNETSIQFTWSDGTTGTGVAPSGYNIKINNADNDGVSAIDAGNNTSYTKTGLTQGQVYYFWVEARGNGPVSGYVAGGAVYTLPAAPANFSISSVTTTSITLSWDAVTSATSYTYYIGTSSSAAANNPTTGHNSTSVTITGLLTNQRYYATVGAVNNQGAGSLASIQNVYTKVGTPTSPTFTPNGGTPTSAPLSWTAPSDGNTPSSYHIRFGTYYTGQASDADHAANNSLSPGNVGNTTSHTISGLTAGGTYYFWVKAVGDGSDSDYTSVLTVELLPSVPTNLSVTTVSTTSVTLSWIAGTGADSYTYWFGTDATYTNNTETNGETGTSVTKTGLAINTKYYLRVKSVNSSGSSGIATVVHGFTLGDAVTNVSVSATSSTSLTISFTQATNQSTVVAHTSLTEAGTKTQRQVGSGGDSSLAVTGLTPNDEYYGWIEHYAQNGDQFFNAVAASVYLPPGTPTSLTITSITASSMILNFTAPTNGASGYVYYFGTDSTATNNTSTVVGDASSITKTGLDPLTTYYFAVKANGTGGLSAISSTINATTTIGVVQDAQIPGPPGQTSIEFEWSDMDGVDGYIVYLADGPFASSPTVTTIATTTNNDYTFTGLNTNTTYYPLVKAYINSPSQESATYSAEVAVLTKPGLILNPAASNITTTQADIDWDAPSGDGSISQYSVIRTLGINGIKSDSPSTIGTPTASNITATGLANSTTYYIYIRATNSTGNGDYTAQLQTGALNFTTLSPTTFTLTATTGTQSNTYYSATSPVIATHTGLTINTAYNKVSQKNKVVMTNYVGSTTVQMTGTSGFSPGNGWEMKVATSNSGLGSASWQDASNVQTKTGDRVIFKLRANGVGITGASRTYTAIITVTNNGFTHVVNNNIVLTA